MTDERCKQLMEQVGMPNSRSLMQSLLQVKNETEQLTRAPLLERIAELEAKLAQRVPDELLRAAKGVLEWTEAAHRPPIREVMEIGRGASVRIHALADLHDAVQALPAAPASPEQQDHPEQHLDMVDQASNAQQAKAQEPSRAVHQFRTAYCSDWYDGLPDHEDGGGPYETRTLFTRPQPAQRPPLTVAEVEAIIARWSYELHGDRARFIVRETELAHGIGEKK